MLNTISHKNRIKNIAMEWNTIGQMIRAKREQRGMTQQQLGDKIGAGKQFIYKLEKGKPCSVKLLNKIAEALECELEVNFKPK